MSRSIKTLLFSTLFPSSIRPLHGVFVETRLRELLKTNEVDTKVVAPVPWFPFSGKHFGQYGKFAATPYFEHRNNLDVFHPRYFLPPKIGTNIAPFMLAKGAIPTIQKIIQDGFNFDLIDAHYYYPDGVAAGLLAKYFKKPFVVTARGTDLNVIPEFPYPKKLILQTSKSASASIAVSQALLNRMVTLGMPQNKLHFIRNGVDLERFKPENKQAARQKLGLPDLHILLSVGNLVELKGHHIAIQALKHLPQNTILVIAGSGPEEKKLRQLATELEISPRVHFVGQIPNEELKWLFSAADTLLLCSSREGWPNVLLESLACGTPAIATNVGGIPEIISQSIAGKLMDSRTTESLVKTLKSFSENTSDTKAIRKYAEQFDWQASSIAQIKIFQDIKHA